MKWCGAALFSWTLGHKLFSDHGRANCVASIQRSSKHTDTFKDHPIVELLNCFKIQKLQPQFVLIIIFDFSHRGKLYNYCKTDSSCDPWCPVKPELVSELGANTTYCTEDILAACDAERESKPKPTCPCLDGGQWSYKGIPQSYCSNPTNSNRYSFTLHAPHY